MFPGQFSPSIFFKFSTYAILLTLPLIYYQSQIYNHEPPFPQCWISDVAAHFPQFVFFRIATISGSAMVLLGWLVNYFYLKTIAKEKVFRISTYHPEICMILGMMGAMLLMGSTANLDTGVRHGKWHTFCASRFFIFTLVAQFYNTFICCVVRYKTKAISRTSIYLKLFIAFLIIVQGFISIEYGVNLYQQGLTDHHLNVILEWTLTITVILGFYAMGKDVENFKFVYTSSSKRQQQQQLQP